MPLQKHVVTPFNLPCPVTSFPISSNTVSTVLGTLPSSSVPLRFLLLMTSSWSFEVYLLSHCPSTNVPSVTCSVTKLCLTLCSPMDCSTPGSSVLHYPLEFAQIHVHWVSDANHLTLCHPFSFCLQSFLAAGSFPVCWLFVSHGHSIGASAAVLTMSIQGWFRLGLTGLISLQSKGLLSLFRIKSQFESVTSSVLSLLYGPTLTSFHDYWKNHSFNYMDLCWLLNMLF